MELLAPAGTMECLKTAVQSGADAVYLAGKQFGARSYAGNFSQEEMYEAAAYCRLRGVKTYVTVNTVALDREFSDLDAWIEVLAEAGVDGVIVQDMGVLQRIHQICPTLPIHGSTQMTVHNADGVLALEKLGVTRVVLARELSKKDIAYISKNTSAELEVFVHGAMCMSYSGQCLMSSVLGGRSGNRGKCAQPCRLAYGKGDGKERFFLSLKDMSLIEHLAELKEMGVTSLKIEGRMKGPAYVGSVVETFRRCMDENRKPHKEELEMLDRVFFRGGLTDGYFTGKTGPAMFAFSKPDNPYEKNQTDWAGVGENRRTALACTAEFEEGKPPALTLIGMGEEIHCFGDAPLNQALKNPANKENILKQLGKTGGTAFFFQPMNISVKGNPFIPIQTINALRRQGISQMEEAILNKAKKQVKMTPEIEIKKMPEPKVLAYSASVQTMEQYMAIAKLPFVRIGIPVHIVYENREHLIKDAERIILVPPVILREEERALVSGQLEELRKMGFQMLQAENIGWLEQAEDFQLWGGHRLNVTNSNALDFYHKKGMVGLCISAELNLAQIRDLKKSMPIEALMYGYLPLMITENCVRKNMDDCACHKSGKLYDRKGKVFPVIKDGTACRSVILNGIPLYMGDKQRDLLQAGVSVGRLCFTIESPEECEQISLAAMAGKGIDKEYTRIHYYKGVL